jgi:hypothetical protein
MMLAVTGKKSSSQFNALDWARVLDHLNKLSGHGQPNAGKPDRWRQGCEALGGKIGALLADQKLPWRYLTHGAHGKPSMLKRLAGVDRLEFAQAPGLMAIITALEKRAAKLKGNPSARDTGSSSSGIEAL